MVFRTACTCSTLEEAYVNRTLESIAELRGWTAYDGKLHRCTSCGQMWLETWEPFMHTDVPVVLKTWVDENGDHDPVGWDLRTEQIIRRG